jgi:hypothetical protein
MSVIRFITDFVEIVTVNLWYVEASFYNLIKREESNLNVSVVMNFQSLPHT